MKVLVTGASGFIGSRILDALGMEGWSATGTSRTGNGPIVGADITDPASLDQLSKYGPFDTVIHCAGVAHRFGSVSDNEYERVNVTGTRNISVFAAENGAKHFVHLSSVLVYGTHGRDVTEEAEVRPVDPYAKSKLLGEEQVIKAASRSSSMQLTILRPAPVIGEGCKGNFPRLIRAIDRGWFINVGDGSARKSMIYVGDVAEACVSLIGSKRAEPIEIFNLSGELTTTGQLVEFVYRSLGKKKLPINVPGQPVRAVIGSLAKVLGSNAIRSAARNLETWLSDDVYSAESLRQRSGYTAATPISEAVRRTVAAYISANRP